MYPRPHNDTDSEPAERTVKPTAPPRGISTDAAEPAGLDEVQLQAPALQEQQLQGNVAQQTNYRPGSAVTPQQPEIYCREIPMCCGLSLVMGIWIIGAVNAVAIFLEIIIWNNIESDDFGSGVAKIFYSWVQLLFLGAVGLLFWALYNKKADFLTPYMIYQLISIVLYFLQVIVLLLIIAGIPSDDRVSEEEWDKEHSEGKGHKRFFAILALLSSAIFCGLEVWFLTLVKRCYDYFKTNAQIDAGIVTSEI